MSLPALPIDDAWLLGRLVAVTRLLIKRPDCSERKAIWTVCMNSLIWEDVQPVSALEIVDLLHSRLIRRDNCSASLVVARARYGGSVDA